MGENVMNRRGVLAGLLLSLSGLMWWHRSRHLHERRLVSLLFRADDVEILPDGRASLKNVRLVGVDFSGAESTCDEAVHSVILEDGHLVVRVNAVSMDDPLEDVARALGVRRPTWVPG